MSVRCIKTVKSLKYARGSYLYIVAVIMIVVALQMIMKENFKVRLREKTLLLMQSRGAKYNFMEAF